MEQEPSLKLNLSSGEFVVTRINTTVYRHMGQYALYDHVFFNIDPENKSGAYMFRNSPAYERISDFVTKNNFPAHVNLLDVAVADREAFDRMMDAEVADVESGVPEEWAKSDS